MATASERVTLSYEPAPGGGTYVYIHADRDATAEDFAEALSAYPDGIEEAWRYFQEMRASE